MFFWYISFASTELVCSKITTFYFLSRFLLLPSFLTCTLCSISCSRQLMLNKIIDCFLAGRRWICTCVVLASRSRRDISPPSTLNITSPLFAWLPFDHCCSNSHVSREFTSEAEHLLNMSCERACSVFFSLSFLAWSLSSHVSYFSPEL